MWYVVRSFWYYLASLCIFQTRDHDWAIYVNPVGVDAAVKTQNTRCVAGGYIWNPFFTQLADPLNVFLSKRFFLVNDS
jgi:hypothetical protein